MALVLSAPSMAITENVWRPGFSSFRVVGDLHLTGARLSTLQMKVAEASSVPNLKVGVDLSRKLPKPLADDAVRAADVVITMGCGDACPVYPGKRYEDWELEDPAGKELAEVRTIRDEIERRVRALLEDVAPTSPSSFSS